MDPSKFNELLLADDKLQRFGDLACELLAAIKAKDAFEPEVLRADYLAKRYPNNVEYELDYIKKGQHFLKLCRVVRDCCNRIKEYTDE